MAYNTKKGSQHTGDIQYEGDPNDTQIDFENDQIILKTGGAPRVNVTNTELSASGIFRTAGSLSGSGDIAISGTIHAAAFYGDGSTLTGVGSMTSIGLRGSSGATQTIAQGNTIFIEAGAGITTTGGATDKVTIESSGTVAQLTTGVETSGYLRVTGSSTLGGAVSGSGTFTVTSLTASADVIISGSVGIGTVPAYDLHVNGAGVTVATIDGGSGADAYLKLATAGTEKGYLKLGSGGNIVLAQDATGGDLLLKAKPGGVSTTYLTLDGGTTTIVAGVPIAAQAIEATAISSSGTLYNAAAATFSSTIAATGSVTAEGFFSTELISGSLGMHIDQPASFGGSIFATGSLSSSATLSVVGSSHFSAPINVSTSVGNVGVVVENTSVDAYGATIALYNSRGGGAGSDNDFAGGVIYRAQNAAAELVPYGKISGKVATNTDGAEDGLIVFEVCDNGTPQTAYLTMDGANSALTASVDIHLQAATHQSGSVYKLYGTRTGDYTLSANDHIIYMNTNSARLTASLPDARTVGGIVYTVKNIGSNDMIIHPYSTQTVDGLSALTGTLGKAWTIQAMDDIWFILSSHQG